MSTQQKRKVMIIGLDGAIPNLFDKFCKEGDLPNISKLRRRGSSTSMLSQIPVATPINWTSITTGAPPGVHGVIGFWSHRWGEPIDKFYSSDAFNNRFIKAERIWEAAEKANKKSIIMKFPGSWPPSIKNGVQVDGYCIPAHGQSILDLAPNGCHSLKPLHGASLIELRSPHGWKNLRKQFANILEGELRIEPKNRGLAQVTYHILIYGDRQFERVMICRSKDTRSIMADLGIGDWSKWIFENFGNVKGTVRFKLIELSPDASNLRIYHSQIYPTKGFTFPDEIGKNLISKVGPFIEFATPHAWRAGWVDFNTCYEEAGYQAKWLAEASEELLKQFDWDLYIMQFHWIDHVQHYFLSLVDPDSPVYDHDSEYKNWKILRDAYQLADWLVGEIIKLADEKTVVIVLSDHGNMPDKRAIALLPLFRESGLIVTKTDELGRTVIDWSKTKVYPCKPGNVEVYINVKGRDANGIVEPGKEYERMRDIVISMLVNLHDDEGNPVFAFVARKEDAVNVGLWGRQLGDVVAVYNPGYTWSGHGGEEWDKEDKVISLPDVNGHDYTAHHGPSLPTGSTKVSSNLAFFLMEGPGIREEYSRDLNSLGPIRVLDVAPTVAYLLCCPPPKHSQGAILYDFLCD